MEKVGLQNRESLLLESLRIRNDKLFYELLHAMFSWQIITWAKKYDLGKAVKPADISQDVFEKIMNAGLDYFEGCNEISCIGKKIYHVTMNTSKNRYAKMLVRRKYSEEEKENIDKGVSVTPEVEKNLFSQDLEQLLEKEVTEKQRKVIVLKISGFKFKEIAEELKISESAAKNRYREGINKLKKAYPLYFVG